MCNYSSHGCFKAILLLSAMFALGNGVHSSGKSFVKIRLNSIMDVWPLYLPECSAATCTYLPRMQIRICVKLNQTSDNLWEESCYPGNQLQVTFNAPAAKVLQSRFELNKEMAGNLTVIIEAIDASTDLAKRGKIVARGVLSEYFHKTSFWRPMLIVNDKKQTFDFSYITKCKRHFYGDDCSKYCRTTMMDNSYNHPLYFCSDDGDRLCFIGWGGENCEDVCKECCIRGTCSIVKPCNCTLTLKDASENIIH